MQNKTILITDASCGLGLAFARHWSVENNVVALIPHKVDLKDDGIAFFKCDLADEAELSTAIADIVKAYPTIDVLINNTDFLSALPLAMLRVPDIAKMIDVNLKAPILISKAIFKRMVRAKTGLILNMVSMAPKLCPVGDSVYAATKSGLETFSKVLNKEGHAYGIRVNNIGMTVFPESDLATLIEKNPNKVLDLLPHKQFAPFDEVVAAVEFFEANKADIGGQTLYFGGV